MKTGRGAGGLLILAEGVLLAAVIILGVLKGLKPEKESDISGTMVVRETEDLMQNLWETESAQEADIQESVTPEEETFSAEVQEQLSAMSTEEKVAQIFLLSPETLTGNETVSIAGEGTRSALEEFPVGGLVYSKNNFQGRGQFGALISGAQRYSMEQSGRYLFLAASSEESGQTVFSALYDAGPLTETMASNRFAGGEENVLYTNSFPEEMQPDTTVPYLIVSGQTNVELTGEDALPCALSSQVMDYIRNTLAYQGLIVTTDLSSAEIVDAYPDGEAAVLAVAAGADMLYVTSDFKVSYQAVLDAVSNGTISETRLNNAVGHILTRKADMPAPADGDIVVDSAENGQSNTNNQNHKTNTDNTADNNGAADAGANQNTDNSQAANNNQTNNQTNNQNQNAGGNENNNDTASNNTAGNNTDNNEAANNNTADQNTDNNQTADNNTDNTHTDNGAAEDEGGNSSENSTGEDSGATQPEHNE